jgi:DNA-binding NarL/FixJ family response regulator
MKVPVPTQTTLLVVDDDPHLIQLLRDYLEFRGYQVMGAAHGKEAMELLSTHPPDLIICDVMMPEMDGYSFVQALRQNSPCSWVPVIFLSAKDQSQDRIRGLSLGGDVYMVKPFEPEELVAQVESSLAASQRLRQHQSGRSDSESLDLPFDVALTPTEQKVVNLVARGLGNRDIALKLKVSQRTVESHVSNMLGKTGLHNRTELARWALDNCQV